MKYMPKDMDAFEEGELYLMYRPAMRNFYLTTGDDHDSPEFQRRVTCDIVEWGNWQELLYCDSHHYWKLNEEETLLELAKRI